MEFKVMMLGDIISEIIDYRGKTPKKLGGKWADRGVRALSAKNIKTGKIVQPETIRFVDKDLYKKWMKQEVEKGTIIITSEAPFGEVLYWNSEEKIVLSQRLFGIKVKNEYNSQYIYYYMISSKFQNELSGRATGTTVIGLRQPELLKCQIKIPNKEVQNKIVHIMSAIDKKIELNNQINDNLSEMINCLYKESFKNLENIKRADEIANITIGKTPPRNIKECFSIAEDDMKWISISDLGKCGTYIFETSERLTLDAVEKYNVKIIPEETLILSFKLTVGRIAITTEKMATNEAIAHFNLYDDKIKYYLYSYLKNFDYEKLGSTSSIATAVNSKIIKAMPIKIPNEEQLEKYNEKVMLIFKKIKCNEKENKTLEQLRDTLLPKLMNGEIDLNNIEI